MSLWTLIVTVFPRRCRLYGQCALTDGLQLWMLFFLGRSGAARVFANLQGHRARLLWARGKRDEATVILREAQVSAGLESDLATCAHIAVFHAEQGRVDEAMRTLRELLTETARDKEVHAAVADAFCLVVIHGNLVGELPEAEQIIRKAIARCPDEILLNVSLAGMWTRSRLSRRSTMRAKSRYHSERRLGQPASRAFPSEVTILTLLGAGPRRRSLLALDTRW